MQSTRCKHCGEEITRSIWGGMDYIYFGQNKKRTCEDGKRHTAESATRKEELIAQILKKVDEIK